MIRKPDELLDKEKKIRILIAGYPGIGKSTLGLSAPKALHIDVDFGADRIEARYRRPFIQPQSYDEILADLVPENLKDYESLVFDTGGKLINLMGLWAMKQDAKNGKRDGNLSLQGYGVVGKEFVRLMDYCFYELDKHIVVLFHATEDRDGDNTRLRLMVEGQTRNNVWIPMDLGGFMEMYGNDRTIGLSNCERYYAKGTRGIKGVLRIPELTEKTPNDFLTKLFAQYNERSAKEIEDTKVQEGAYSDALAVGNDIIASIVDADTALEVRDALQDMPHALTSEMELKAIFAKKIKELGLAYDRKAQVFVVSTPSQPDEQDKTKPAGNVRGKKGAS